MASDASPNFRRALISSIIVELAKIVSSQDRNNGRLTYQSTLFPEPATKGRNYQSLRKSKRHAATHVFRGSIEANSVPMTSILRTCCLERTMSRSLRGAIRGQRCDSSTDQEERANGRYLAATCHLQDDYGESRKWWRHYGITDVSTCSFHWQLDVGFLRLSKARNGLVVAN